MMNRKATLFVLLVFVLGLVLGALGMHVVGDRIWASGRDRGERSKAEGGRKGQEKLVEKLTRELQLTSEQRAQLVATLEETKEQYHAIYERVRPEYDQVRKAGRDRIRAFLSEEQKPKFEAFLQRIDDDRRKYEHR